MRKGLLGVRKGAWTEEEDLLMRKCIEEYGEGKWHLVPLRAGLNRCRKSCRLRWLNYLRPNIKRGEFTFDEVDLIIRLHKLLGNRWSLIAGRLPGRTANDVKNYWNTHLYKKMLSRQEDMKDRGQKTVRVNVIKPRPRSFSKSLSWLRGKTTIVDNIVSKDNFSTPSPTLPPPKAKDGIPWWESLFFDEESDKGATSSPIASLWAEDIALATKAGDTFVEEGQTGTWNEFSFDMDIWDLLSVEKETVI